MNRRSRFGGSTSSGSRRIYTDGREWPANIEPSYAGYSIGKWIDTDGDGRFDVLEVETRGFKGPRTLDSTAIPLHEDNQTIVKERIFMDKSVPNVLRDEVIGRTRGIAGVVAHAVDRRVAAVQRRRGQRDPRDRAVAHLELLQVARRDLHQLDAAPAQPGVQPQLQPFANAARRRQRAQAEGGDAGEQSVAQRRRLLRVRCRRHKAVVGVVPTELEADVLVRGDSGRGEQFGGHDGLLWLAAICGDAASLASHWLMA